MKKLMRLLALVLCGLCLFNAQLQAKDAMASATAEALCKALTESQRTALLTLLNEGETTALEAISGIGPARAAAIIEQRPFAAITDVMRVKGVGEGTFAKMVAHAQAGFPQKEPSKKRSSKTKGAESAQ